MSYALHPYQHEAVKALVDDLREMNQGLIAMATGTGKTIIGGAVLRHEYEQARWAGRPFRGLWLSQTDELVQQPLDRMARMFPDYIAEDHLRLGKVQSDKGMDFDATIISASIQSLYADSGSRIRRMLEFGDITHVCWDEVHHGASPSYIAVDKMLTEACPGLKKWGQTATPERHDEQTLDVVFPALYRKGRYTYIYSIMQAIKEGYLSPFKPQQLFTADMAGVKFFGDDADPEQMMQLYKAGNWPELLYQGMTEHGGLECPTIVFMPSVDISEAFAQWMSDEKNIPYGFMSSRGCGMALNGQGYSPAGRSEVLQAYQRGDLVGISNMKILTEGVDLPHTARIIMGRPSGSNVDMSQMIGRGLRTFPGKEICHLLFIGWSGRPIPNYSLILYGNERHRDADKLEQLFKQLQGKTVSQVSYLCMECLAGQMKIVPGSEDSYKCDACGAIWRPTDSPEDSDTDLSELLFDRSAIQGKTVYARMLDLTSKSKAAWYTHKQIFSLGLGLGRDGCDRIILVAPPGVGLARDEYNLAVIKRAIWQRYVVTYPTKAEKSHMDQAWEARPSLMDASLQWWKHAGDQDYDAVVAVLSSDIDLAMFEAWCAEWDLGYEAKEKSGKKYGDWHISATGSDENAGDLMTRGEQGTLKYLNPKLAQKNEAWRKKGATAPQLSWAKQLVEQAGLTIQLRPDLSRGSVGQIISHCLAVQFLRSQGWDV